MALRGFRVLVVEAHSRHRVEAFVPEDSTQPGFVHAVGAGFFPFGRSSPAFRELDLESVGLRWANAEFESCHPALDGSYACIARDALVASRHFGAERDGETWRKLAGWHAQNERHL